MFTERRRTLELSYKKPQSTGIALFDILANWTSLKHYLYWRGPTNAINNTVLDPDPPQQRQVEAT